MKKELKQLLREQRLTGEAVGQLLIRDMVHTYRQRLGQAGEPPLGEQDKQQLVSALSTPEEMQMYAKYRQVQHYLLQVRTFDLLAWQRAEAYYLRLFSTLGQMEGYEDMLALIHALPRWMRPEEYQAALDAERAHRDAASMDGHSAQAMMCDLIAQDDADPLQADARSFLQQREQAPQAMTERLRADYPALQAEVTRRLRAVPGFTPDDLGCVLRARDALAAGYDLLGAYLGAPASRISPTGCAAMLGDHPAPEFAGYEDYAFDKLLPRLGEGLALAYKGFLGACREGFAVRAGLALVGERIGVAGLDLFLSDVNPDTLLAQVAELVGDIPAWARPGAPDDPVLKAQLTRLFPPVSAQALRPTDARLAAARATLQDLAVMEAPALLHAALLGEGAPRRARRAKAPQGGETP
ncbi:MAG: hypothetical protein LBU67_03395 [Oscillospiraceae bacterium]|jgi:hypothetical protein|nr:hypothetical protein [Oscillospiraceae bacterium]